MRLEVFALVLVLVASPGVSWAGTAVDDARGDPHRGAQLFQQSAACHSVEPGGHLTGPSLACVWGRKAGT